MHTHGHSHRPSSHTASPSASWALKRQRRQFIESPRGSHALGCGGPGSPPVPSLVLGAAGPPPGRNGFTGHAQEVRVKGEERAHWGSLKGAYRSPGPAPSSVHLCWRGATCSKEHQPRPCSCSSCPRRGSQGPQRPREVSTASRLQLHHSVKPRPSARPGPSDKAPRMGLLSCRNVLLPVAGWQAEGGAVWSGLHEGPLWLQTLPPRESRWHPFDKGTNPVPAGPTSSRHDFEGAALVGDTVHRTWPLIRPLAKGHQLQVVDGWAQFSKPGSWGQSWRGLHTQPGDTLTRPGRTLRADPFWST